MVLSHIFVTILSNEISVSISPLHDLASQHTNGMHDLLLDP